ncbi:MAG: DMT family transporter [Alphaproteobacteria bacterium]|nr:DMT family transporter [Alphaproteobacteria bacterium]
MLSLPKLHLSPQQRGVVLALVGIGCLGLMNALVKWYSNHYSSMQLLFFRNFVGFVVFVAIVAARGGKGQLKSNRPFGHFWRGFLGTCSLGLSFFCYHHLPLGTAVSIVLTYPMFVALFSKWYLSEPMPHQFWLFLLLGFAGVVLISQPTMDGEWWIIALGLLNALLWAMARMTTRSLTRSDPPVTIVFYYYLIGSLGPAILLLSIAGQWQPLQQTDWLGLLAMGGLGALAQLLITRALALAPAWRVAPLEYSLLLWAIGFDWLWWNKLPAFASLVGAALITVVGVSLLGRRAKAVADSPLGQ